MTTIIDARQLDDLRELIGGDEEALAELIATFVVEGDEIVADMRAALADADLERLRRGAHSLKSSAQDFGATALSARCASLESACRVGWPATAADDVAGIDVAFRAARRELSGPGSDPG